MSAELVGPFSEYRVVVEGRRVPLLTATELAGGQITIVLDERFAITVPAGVFDQVAWLLANALALADGRPAHSIEERTWSPFTAPRMVGIHNVEITEEGS